MYAGLLINLRQGLSNLLSRDYRISSSTALPGLVNLPFQPLAGCRGRCCFCFLADWIVGKTSTILALARRIYGAKNMRQMVLELNASDDRGIEVVREQIKTFASTKQIFTMNPTVSSSSGSIANFKLIILDEADAMTATAQMALRRIMEKYTANTRFCVIANYAHKLSPALLSRCTRFRFSPLKEVDIRVLVDKVIEEEKVNITPEATDALVKLSKGDMRRALNVLQACHASSKPFTSAVDF